MRFPLTAPVVRLALAALLLLLALVPARGVSAADTIVADEVNLRTGPGLEFAILDVLPAGAAVTVLDEPFDGWYPVDYAGLEGWVFGDYLLFFDDAGNADDARNADTVNLRAGPGLDYDIIGVIYFDEPLDILDGPEFADGYTWLLVVTDDGYVGWVAEELLANGAPADSVTAVVRAGE